MAETIQICCNEGAVYAWNHTLSDCQGTLTVPPEIPSAFGSMCLLAKAQCCKEYFKKQSDCETGIDIATSTYSCDNTKSISKICCNDCSRGTTEGSTKGPEACKERKHGMNAEELLAEDAFITCCKNAVTSVAQALQKRLRTGKVTRLPEVQTLLLYLVTKNRCKPHNPCQHKCNDNGVEVKCSCRRGYELMPDGTSCQDIDECQLDVPVCLAGTHCQNLQGSYRCISGKKNNAEKGQCPPGFARNLNNNVCDDINECLLPNPPCPKYVCENTIGGYSCGGVTGNPENLSTSPRTHVEDRCPPGFKVGLHEECEDVDECALRKDDCNPLSQFCINTHSSFYCQDKVSKHCPPGFKLDPKTNKCEEGGVNCGPDQVCVNQLGRYDCKAKDDPSKTRCPDGMRLSAITHHCEDVDECVEGTHICDQHQQCLNTNGSYDCYCKLGYELDITTGACVGKEETDANNTKPQEPSTTTTQTPKPVPPPTSSTTTEKPVEPEPRIEDNNVEPPPYNIPDVYKNEASSPKYETQPTTIPAPSTTPEPPTTVPQQPETEPTEEPRQPEVTFNRPTPPEYIPEAELPKPTEEPRRQPEPTYPPRVEEPTNESLPPVEPETTYRPTEESRISPPYQVVVSVGKETATLPAEKNDDGSYVIDTQQVPKNQWTKVNVPNSCAPGFEPDEYGACFDIDECATNRHSCSGLTEVCKNTIGGYTCNCAPGFRRDLITKSCEFVTTSSSTTTTPAPHFPSSTKRSFFWGYPEYRVTARPFRPRNLCDAGFHHNSKTGECEVEICINTPGGYRCECPPNWRLDEVRHRCVPLKNNGQFPTGYGNEPVYPSIPPNNVPTTGTKYVDPEITQVDDRGSVFRCPNGYTLGDENTCVDVNECLTGEAKCGPQQICTNLPGGYSCNCPHGHRLVRDHECEDVDECALAGNLPVCSQNADCVNTIGSYQCKCHVGFRSAPVNDKLKLFTMRGPVWPYVKMRFELKLINVNAPPSVKRKAEIHDFLLTQNNNEGLTSLVRPLEGPQSIELEMSMELYTHEQFGGTAVAKLFIYVSEYEF
ncbi:hypothetical protein HF086_016503 [Spodoptera exigua]|uniref:EGF-like domain-containing protein n=1 Tax=Spodoptera exigua TaxID=7107 RepID=A0A922SNY3_SPOEX|nr:hypothetical protein HF086_016503 [Spodoptera exigua]